MGRCLTESLEPRRLFAAAAAPPTTPPTIAWAVSIGSASAELTSRGTLVVHGSGADDRISVIQGNGDFLVQTGANSSTFKISRVFDPKKVQRILIEGAGGDDHLSVAADVHATMAGGNGNDVLVGGRGDVLVGGAGDDKLLADLRGTAVNLSDLQSQNGINTGEPTEFHGGMGRDRLYGFGVDTMDGGGGRDNQAFLYQIFLANQLPPLPDDPAAFAEDQFRDPINIDSFGLERNLIQRTVNPDGSETIVLTAAS
jgi:hypothetical protein